jgi:hypothetical protein
MSEFLRVKQGVDEINEEAKGDKPGQQHTDIHTRFSFYKNLYWYYRALTRPPRSRIGAKALRKYQDRGIRMGLFVIK